ncbi:MAG: ZIP family metal transporter [Alistipes sp.]|nr:ZIP family metal transporter [Alistipes sp.]
MTTTILTGLLIPFAGTTIGAAAVFLLRHDIPQRLQKVLLGFASGVMMAAAVWSLLLPAIDMSRESSLPSWLPAAGGFILGTAFLLLLDTIIPHLHVNADKAEGFNAKLRRTTKLVLAVTLHNIPEGMAVGVVIAGALSHGSGITAAGAMALSLGIAIQNIPEGAIVSMPMMSDGGGKGRSFLYGVLSGIVEPIAGIITILLIDTMLPALPWLLAFAAGAMLYVVIEELIPEAQQGEHSNTATIGAAAGFVLMMILDVALG